jgi:Na+/phosphate symporter
VIEIGIGLTLFGILFTLLGVILMFDKGFITIGNILFLSGLILVIGFVGTYNFFFQKKKWKGTAIFFVGLILVLMGRSFFGIVFESVGAIMLFGNFLSKALDNIPLLGMIFRQFTGNSYARLPE